MTDIAPPSTAGELPVVYDPAAIERKWQTRWEAEGTNTPDLANGPNPYYALMMFPVSQCGGTARRQSVRVHRE